MHISFPRDKDPLIDKGNYLHSHHNRRGEWHVCYFFLARLNIIQWDGKSSFECLCFPSVFLATGSSVSLPSFIVVINSLPPSKTTKLMNRIIHVWKVKLPPFLFNLPMSSYTQFLKVWQCILLFGNIPLCTTLTMITATTMATMPIKYSFPENSSSILEWQVLTWSKRVEIYLLNSQYCSGQFTI